MKIAIINHKGGVGKTTIAVNTAFRYQEKKKRLLLVDTDLQHNSIQLISGYTWDGEDVIWYDSSGLITVTTGLVSGMRNYPDDVIFDCSPSFESSKIFIEYLQNEKINIDVFLVPVNSRMSIIGADTIIKNIKQKYSDIRIVLIPYNFENNILTEKDRAQLIQFPNVEVYSQVIPRHSKGLALFEQNGGKPIWKLYAGTRFAVQMRELSDWIRCGCTDEITRIKGKEKIGGVLNNNKILNEFGEVVLNKTLKQFIKTKSNKWREYEK
jgi:cellulose biosynthesis protein BcsQ